MSKISKARDPKISQENLGDLGDITVNDVPIQPGLSRDKTTRAIQDANGGAKIHALLTQKSPTEQDKQQRLQQMMEKRQAEKREMDAMHTRLKAILQKNLYKPGDQFVIVQGRDSAVFTFSPGKIEGFDGRCQIVLSPEGAVVDLIGINKEVYGSILAFLEKDSAARAGLDSMQLLNAALERVLERSDLPDRKEFSIVFNGAPLTFEYRKDDCISRLPERDQQILLTDGGRVDDIIQVPEALYELIIAALAA